MSNKKRGLGKGLEALLGGSPTAATIEKEEPENSSELSLDVIYPGRYQPRSTIQEEELETLAASIRAQGIIQPIVVKKNDDRYEIIAGERRWRAARLAGLATIPAIIKDLSDEQATAIALIENIQREDLNPIEEARALERLSREFNLTHQQVAQAVGKSRATVTNLLRLLALSETIRRYVEQGQLDMGHAKVLLSLDGEQQLAIAKQVVSEGLSVRATERLLSQKPAATSKPTRKPLGATDPDVLRLEKDLSEKLAAQVQIKHSDKGKGSVVIRFNNLDELEGILSHVH